MGKLNNKKIRIDGKWYRIVEWNAYPMSPSPQPILILDPITTPVDSKGKD